VTFGRHRSLQPRLDGYRTTAGTFLAALIAFAAAFDAFTFQNKTAIVGTPIAYIMTAMILFVCGLVIIVLFRARRHFAEMSGFVVRLDQRAGLFDLGPNGEETIYPQAWNSTLNNGKPGWSDFAIDYYCIISIIILIAQILILTVLFEWGPAIVTWWITH
jgi:hypothetical protein